MSRRKTSVPIPMPALELDSDSDSDAELAAKIGEWLRRVALGLTAALMVARTYWPSEPDYRNDVGSGTVWVFALLLVVGIAIAAGLVGGTLRLRISWADVAMIVLMLLVGSSASHAIDRRPAINIAWEWGGMGLLYLLARNLPRTRGESQALAGALAATAFALSIYAFYQVGVELPYEQAKFLRNEAQALRIVEIEPGTPQHALFRSRLLGSNEPFATFAMANSLAGFLVGPLVVLLALGWTNLTRRDERGTRLGSTVLLAIPTLAILVCLVMTKSRSAYIGLTIGLLVLAWRERKRVGTRILLRGGLAALILVGALIAAGLATGRLDRQVLTEAGKSFSYRTQYWTGAWRAIHANPRAYWTGYGPGNFAAPYVLHKLPEASEDVKDPHNFLLEVWAISGLTALIPLVLAVCALLWNGFAPSRKSGDEAIEEPGETSVVNRRMPTAPDAAPVGSGWLIGCAGLGWLLACPPLGQLNPFSLTERWLILGLAWLLAIGLGQWAWRRQALEPAWLTAGALAVLVNLLAAGGIGIPAVALGLWVAFALALNLREDRPCGRLREATGGRFGAFGFAAVWVALLGTFIGAILPHWKAEAAMADAQDALRSLPPAYEKAEAAYLRAKDSDKLSARPWLSMAALEYAIWDMRGAKVEDLRWRKIPFEMAEAASGNRPANNWTIHRERAKMTTLILKRLGDRLGPKERLNFMADVVNASRLAVRLNPTNAMLHAWLAESSADIHMYPDALTEGQEALRLDKLTPHADRKLDPKIRQWIEANLKDWEKNSKASPDLKALQERLQRK